MRSDRYLRAWSPIMLLAGVWLGAAVPARAAPDHASVLILLPGQPGLPAATAIASGIRAALLTEWSFRVTIEMEHVDVARFASPEAEERRLRTVYSSKYGNQRFDVIVTALPEPFQFILRARDDLWPGTPVVVCGVDERSVGDLKLPPGFAVLTIRFDMRVRCAQRSRFCQIHGMSPWSEAPARRNRPTTTSSARRCRRCAGSTSST
jgi:two-component system cell cycle sensor histidine kinase/response regulator CckA